MSVTASDVKTVATELTSVADATITRWIAIVERRIDQGTFGNKADDAITFLTAHCVTLAERANAGSSGSSGAMTSRTVGGVSASFAVPTASVMGDEMLQSTFWGQLYLDLRNGLFADRRI